MDGVHVLGALEIDDAYEVLRVLADGPAGRTELVRVGASGLLVRKRIPLGLANAAAWTKLMDMENPLLPHVVNLYRLPDELAVVYTWVEGTSLADVVRSSGRLTAGRAAELLVDVCRAADALHAIGIVHRDIVPANVVVDEDGRAHLIDLGIARIHDDDAPTDTRALGTWGFAAPEQFGFAQTDARSDVYSLGRLLAFMLTGTLPDESGFDDALADADTVPAALVETISRACAFEPSGRFGSADELAHAVLAAVKLTDGETLGEHESGASDGIAGMPSHGAQASSGDDAVARVDRRMPKGIAAFVIVGVALACLLAARGAMQPVESSTDGSTAALVGLDEPTSVATGTDGEEGAVYPDDATVSADDHADLVLADSAYVIDGGYVHCVVAIENPNDDVSALFADVKVTGRTTDGTVAFSDGWVVGPTMPHATTYWASMAGDGQVRKGDVVEVSLSTHSWYWSPAASSDAATYEFSGVTLHEDGLTGLHASGEVTLRDDGVSGNEGGVSDPMLVCVLRDADGRLVAGFEGFTWADLSVGQPVPFDINALFAIPHYERAEMYANPLY